MKKSSCSAALLVIIVSIIASLTGCASPTNYGRSDIKKYVEDNIGIENFTVSRSYKMTDIRDFRQSDRIWTVTDNDSGLEFHVIDYRYPEGAYSFGILNNLLDDYPQQVIKKYADQLPQLSGFDYSEFASPDKAKEYLLEYGYLTGSISATFRTKSDLMNFQNSIEQLRSAIDDLGIARPMGMNIHLEIENKYSDGIAGCAENMNLWDDFDPETVMTDYVSTLYEYRYDEEAMSELSHDEVVKYLNEDRWTDFVGVYHNGEDKPADFYDDIIYMTRGDLYISIGSLHELLKREGISVEGTPEHYTFKGIDGAEYEAAYEYFDIDKETNAYGETFEYRHWYYLKDGQKIPMESMLYFGFHSNEIQEMTGIKLIDYQVMSDARNERRSK